MTEHDSPTGLSRRGFVVGGASVAASVAIWTGSAAPAFAAATPTLPGEKSRKANQTTNVGKKPYDNIEVDIKGDLARIFVPQSVKPGQSTPVPVVWFYHAPQSTHDAMNGGFLWNAEYVVDQGWIAICQTAGGAAWTNSVAEKAQLDGWAYVNSVFPVRDNLLRATSGGGALACGVYATRAIPKLRGIYLVNGVYDLWATYAYNGRDAIGPAFGYNETLIKQRNPAIAPQSAWKGANIRVVYSVAPGVDTTVPPKDHSLALIAKAKPVASEASSRTHTLGHTQPSWAWGDSITAFKRWVS
ncbi:hypothetical protein ACDF64_06480 [Agromyces sp. MMS24-JH15]|uniref:hypothetical protein n=1 Tax=Agromyces sp. MMS24-JH15 TaxID=3243765 RepID=UPI003748FADB